jgi:excisionase family DNA binding protein
MSQHATRTLEGLLTPTEVCERLRISRATFYRLVRDGELRAVRLGRREGASLRVRDVDLERLLAPATKGDPR